MSSFHRHLFIEPKPRRLTATEVEALIQEGKLLRILLPELRSSAERALATDIRAYPYIVESNDQLYLAFDCISQPEQQRQAYRLIQQYQLGGNIDPGLLPVPLRRIVQPELTQTGRLLGALILSASAGLVIGVLAMAVTILVAGIMELLAGNLISKAAGIEITALIFVTFGTVGWIVSAVFAWKKLNPETLGRLASPLTHLSEAKAKPYTPQGYQLPANCPPDSNGDQHNDRVHP